MIENEKMNAGRKIKAGFENGLRVSQINAGNIWAISRTTLEHLFLERERTRDIAIGIAFMTGGLTGSVMAMLLIWWLP